MHEEIKVTNNTQCPPLRIVSPQKLDNTNIGRVIKTFVENETALYRQIFQYIQSGNYPGEFNKSQKFIYYIDIDHFILYFYCLSFSVKTSFQ